MDSVYITKQATTLKEALERTGLKCDLEFKDGHKCIDIRIEEAKINIEVNGIQHYTNSKQINADFHRVFYSQKEGYATFAVTNQLIDRFPNEIADALSSAARKRMKEINKN